MAKNAKYWLGPGNALIDGVKYKPGQVIPSEKVSSAKIKEWEEAGSIGTAPFDRDESQAVQSMAEKHKSEISKIAGELVEANKAIEKLSNGLTKDTEIKDLTDKVAAKDTEIKDLTEQVAAKDVEIADLNKQVADLTEPEKR